MDIYENIKLKKEGSEHLYIQLYKSLKELMAQKKLNKGDQLPSIRKLSDILGVNNGTVVNAYHLLEEEGLVHKRAGSGTYISTDLFEDKSLTKSLKKEEKNFSSAFLTEPSHFHLKKNMINFASTTPSAELFPVQDFKEVMNEVLDRDKGHAFGYQESQGYYPLRKALKEYIYSYGIKTDVENIQIISGAQQGIDIISRSLLNHEDAVIIESPTYTGAMAAFEVRGADIIDIPMEKDGIDLKMLENKIRQHKPKIIYVMPNYQNPTGITYSLEKKKKLIEICKKNNIVIIEDDYLSDLNFYGKNNATLKSMDETDSVIYIKSFSKVLMPGLRLGFLVAPSVFFENLLAVKHASDISTSGLLQRLLELYFKKGIWDKHIKYIDAEYKKRLDKMKECVEKYMPKEVEYTLPVGGITFWFKLPFGLSSKNLYEKAFYHNIVFAPGNLFFINKEKTEYFRLSIAATDINEIEYGMRKLSGIIQSYIDYSTKNDLKSGFYQPIL